MADYIDFLEATTKQPKTAPIAVPGARFQAHSSEFRLTAKAACDYTEMTGGHGRATRRARLESVRTLQRRRSLSGRRAAIADLRRDQHGRLGVAGPRTLSRPGRLAHDPCPNLGSAVASAAKRRRPVRAATPNGPLRKLEHGDDRERGAGDDQPRADRQAGRPNVSAPAPALAASPARRPGARCPGSREGVWWRMG